MDTDKGKVQLENYISENKDKIYKQAYKNTIIDLAKRNGIDVNVMAEIIENETGGKSNSTFEMPDDDIEW